MVCSGRTARTSYAEVFDQAEFRAVWLSQIVSLIGDQIGRVAVSVLVFARTGSPALAAVVYALSFLPWVVGGPLLAGLADSRPRRTVMVTCDLGRALLVALMAVPAMPLVAVVALLLFLEVLGAPYSAARGALLPDLLPGDLYVLGSAVRSMTAETGQLLGFVSAGGVVLATSPRGALLIDAVTFLVSAALVTRGVRHRPAAAAPAGDAKRAGAWVAGVRLLAANPRLRALAGLAWLCAFYVVPEGLAVPLVNSMGGGAGSVGLLLAANPAGALVGALVVARCFTPERRMQLLPWLAVLSTAPLLGCALHPSLPMLIGLVALSGVGSSYNLPASAAFVTALPNTMRARGIGVVNAGMYAGQGLAVVAAGLAAQAVAPLTVVAVAGGLGLVVVAATSKQSRHFSIPSAEPLAVP